MCTSQSRRQQSKKNTAVAPPYVAILTALLEISKEWGFKLGETSPLSQPPAESQKGLEKGAERQS